MRSRFLATAVAIFGCFLLLEISLEACFQGIHLPFKVLPARTSAGWIAALQDDTNVTCRMRAADALWQIGESVVPEVACCLHHKASQVRSAACLALTRMGPTAKAAVPNLVELVQEPTEKIRLEAIWALASIGPAARPAVTVLTEAAGDKDLVIRHAATHALRQIGPPAVPALLHLLDDDDPQTRRKVVEALGRSVSRSQVVCGALALHAVDEDAGVRAAAFAALSLKGHDAVHHLESLMQNEDPTARSQAAMSLCRMGVNAQMATPTLLGALNDENANVRFWALRALAALALERTAEHDQVHSTLDDPDPDVRWQAIDTINRAGIREAGFVVHQRHDRQNR